MALARGPPDRLGFTKCTIALEKRKMKVTAVVLQKFRSSWPTETAQNLAPMVKQASKNQKYHQNEELFKLLGQQCTLS